MGKKSPKAPAAPDPVATAAAQTQQNKDTAYWNAVLNNVNQYTPYGSLEYKQTGGGKTYNMDAYNAAMKAFNTAVENQAINPYAGYVYQERYRANPEGYRNPQTGEVISVQQYASGGGGGVRASMPKLEDYFVSEAPPSFSATTKLSPEQQAIYDTQTAQEKQLLDLGGQQIGRIQESVATPYSYAGIADGPTNESIMEQQLRAEEALMSRLNPQFGRDEEAMRTRLINQGITQGSEVYKREMDTFNQMKNDARVQAILGGQQYGGNAQNQAMQRRNQAIQEYAAQRTAPLNEYIGFTSGTQVQNPQFQNINYSGINPVDIAGLTQNKYNADYQNYANKVATRNQNMSTLGSLAMGAATMGMGGMGGGLFKALPNSIGQGIGFATAGAGAYGPWNSF